MIERAAMRLLQGEIVAFPTETVYGLGASVFLSDAIAQIYALKGRPSDNPLIVHISSLDQLDGIVSYFPDGFTKLVDHFFPGPLTVILPKGEKVPECVTAGLMTVAVRMPSHPLASALIEKVGPLVAPSANLSGRPSSTHADHVRADFGDQIEVLEGECGLGLESTVLQLEPIPKILRPGAITAEQLVDVLERPVSYHVGSAEQPASPGMKYRHYAPKGKIHLVTEPPKSGHVIHPKAETLYAQLRAADDAQIDEIFVVCDTTVQRNRALMDRLLKASWG